MLYIFHILNVGLNLVKLSFLKKVFLISIFPELGQPRPESIPGSSGPARTPPPCTRSRSSHTWGSSRTGSGSRGCTRPAERCTPCARRRTPRRCTRTACSGPSPGSTTPPGSRCCRWPRTCSPAVPPRRSRAPPERRARAPGGRGTARRADAGARTSSAPWRLCDLMDESFTKLEGEGSGPAGGSAE